MRVVNCVCVYDVIPNYYYLPHCVWGKIWSRGIRGDTLWWWCWLDGYNGAFYSVCVGVALTFSQGAARAHTHTSRRWDTLVSLLTTSLARTHTSCFFSSCLSWQLLQLLLLLLLPLLLTWRVVQLSRIFVVIWWVCERERASVRHLIDFSIFSFQYSRLLIVKITCHASQNWVITKFSRLFCDCPTTRVSPTRKRIRLIWSIWTFPPNVTLSV